MINKIYKFHQRSTSSNQSEEKEKFFGHHLPRSARLLFNRRASPSTIQKTEQPRGAQLGGSSFFVC